MQLIDTHTHLYLPEFDADRDEVVNRAVRQRHCKNADAEYRYQFC